MSGRVIRIAMAQINVTVGAVADNVEKILGHIDAAARAGAHLVAFPELAVCGYPPEDLLFHPRFVTEVERGLARVAEGCTGPVTAVVGTVVPAPGGRLHNAAAVIRDGRVRDVYHKLHLPNYGVFDEKRYFEPGGRLPVYRLGGVPVGVSVCEDIWIPEGPPYRQAVTGGARVLVNINASPYHAGKREERERLVVDTARRSGAYVCYNNLVGGQDELVFDGQGIVVGPDGAILAHGGAFTEELLVADLDLDAPPAGRRAPEPVPGPGEVVSVPIDDAPLSPPPEPAPPHRVPPLPRLEEIRRALLLGIRDYLGKNGFSAAVVGLSGGIDSALVATLAAEALGPDNVTCVFMPTRYTSAVSTRDAERLAASIGTRLVTLAVDDLFAAYLHLLKGVFGDRPPDEAEENLQPRIRGNVLMALSNKFGWLVLTTGNKSEMAVGYATLYGDMAGGFAVIKDLPKHVVFDLARHINADAGREVIPAAILERPPTAELKENQLDTDALPPYDVLDPILQAYVQEARSLDEIVALGFDRALVSRVIRMVDGAEYKRRQAPPGIRITPRAFGRDRRMPITNRFRE